MCSTAITTMSAVAVLSIMGASAASAQTLDVWIRASNDSLAVYETIAKNFTEKTGVEINYFNATTDFEQRIVRAAAGRDLPDLVFNDAAALGQMLDMGIIEEVDQGAIDGGDQIVPIAWDSARGYDGKYYAVPTSAQSFALFVRKDWREAVGLPQPKTWEDLHKLAEAFTQQDPDGNGQADTYGFTLPASTTRGYTSWFLSNFIWQAGGQFLAKDGDGFRPDLNTDATASALAFMRDMVCDGLVQPNAINATTADAIPSFRSGQTGIFLSGPYHIALFDDDPGKDVIEVVPPPAGPAGVASLAEGTNVYFMKGSENTDAARAFVEYMISPEGQTTGMAIGSGSIPVVRLPVIKSLDVQDLRQDARWQVFADVYQNNGRYVPEVPNWTPIRATTAEGFNRILASCDSDIRAELAALDEDVAAELRSQDVLAQ